jgi:probable HAF family extracellular repeat protein
MNSSTSLKGIRAVAAAVWLFAGACGSSTGNGDGSAKPTDGPDSSTVDAPADKADAAGGAPGTDASADEAPEDAGVDTRPDTGVDGGHVACPAVGPLKEIPAQSVWDLNYTAVDLGSAGAAVIYYGDPGSNYSYAFSTVQDVYLGIFGGPTQPDSTAGHITGQSPSGFNAVGMTPGAGTEACTLTGPPPGGFPYPDPGCGRLWQQYQFPYPALSALDVNDAGVVVGVIAQIDHPYSWTLLGGPIDLGTLGGSSGTARAVNAAGTVTGESSNAAGATHAFSWDGALHDLGTLGGASSSGTAINAAGDVVGVAKTAAGADHAFLWHAGAMQDLGTLGGASSAAVAINAAGQIVGTSQTATNETHAFFWSEGGMHDLGTLGGAGSRVDGRRPLDDAGQVVGTSQDAAGVDHAFIWQLGVMRDLGTLGGATSSAVSINASGRVVGNSLTAAGLTHAFFVDPGACAR